MYLRVFTPSKFPFFNDSLMMQFLKVRVSMPLAVVFMPAGIFSAKDPLS
jgi:hypothetical protein